jgi:hypothetical protein
MVKGAARDQEGSGCHFSRQDSIRQIRLPGQLRTYTSVMAASDKIRHRERR